MTVIRPWLASELRIFINGFQERLVLYIMRVGFRVPFLIVFKTSTYISSLDLFDVILFPHTSVVMLRILKGSEGAI